MKKVVSFLLSLCLLATMLVTLSVPAFAAEKDFMEDYFPSGKIAMPEAPYIKEVQFEGQATALKMYYYQTSELQKLALDIQRQGDFYEKYGLAQLDTFIQVDVKFNDGEWVSSKGNWGTLNEWNSIDYGEGIIDWNLVFLHVGIKGAEDADKLLSFTQSWLTYFDPGADINAYLMPFVKSEINEYGDPEYFFDFENVKISYRIRWCVRFLVDEATENEHWEFYTSDWSPETSIGRNGTQEELKMPDKLDAPVLSEFELKANEDGSGSIHYFATLPDSIYDAVRYRLISENGFEPYYIDAEAKINDGDWFVVDVSNSTWIENGHKDSWVSDDHQLKQTDNAWIRVRVVSTQDENEYSEWSNIIGTKAIEGAEDPTNPAGNPTEASTDQGGTSIEKTKCKVCGICPIQPLGICLFIWIAIILVIILVVAIVVLVANKKKDKKEQQKQQ